jgi:hypothetical protein
MAVTVAAPAGIPWTPAFAGEAGSGRANPVIPAKAGIQIHSRLPSPGPWTPASAGVTTIACLTPTFPFSSELTP